MGTYGLSRRERLYRSYDYDRKEMDYFDLRTYDDKYHNNFGNVMDYIGLEDKNGTKVFEGDIVDMKQDGKSMIKIIKYSCGYSPTRHAGYNISPIYRDTIEVMGNVFENPKLLDSYYNEETST